MQSHLNFNQGQNWRIKRLDRLVEAVSGGDYGGWDEMHDLDNHEDGVEDEKPTEHEDEYRDEINEDIPEDDEEHFQGDQFKPSQLSPKVFNNQLHNK